MRNSFHHIILAIASQIADYFFTKRKTMAAVKEIELLGQYRHQQCAVSLI
jgi:hypothetical protein